MTTRISWANRTSICYLEQRDADSRLFGVRLGLFRGVGWHCMHGDHKRYPDVERGASHVPDDGPDIAREQWRSRTGQQRAGHCHECFDRQRGSKSELRHPCYYYLKGGRPGATTTSEHCRQASFSAVHRLMLPKGWRYFYSLLANYIHTGLDLQAHWRAFRESVLCTHSMCWVFATP